MGDRHEHLDGTGRDRVVASAATGGPGETTGAFVATIDKRSRLLISEDLRRWLDVTSGSRLLVATAAERGQVVLAPATELDSLFPESNEPEKY